jgi:hypothetical protein
MIGSVANEDGRLLKLMATLRLAHRTQRHVAALSPTTQREAYISFDATGLLFRHHSP